MKRFEFTLESILNIRIQEEEDAKIALAERENELSRLKSELDVLKIDLNEFQEEEKISRGLGGQSADKLRQSVSWRHKFKKDISQKIGLIEQVNKDIAVARNLLIEKTKKRKGLDVLKENQLKAWKKEYNRKEQIFLDELAQNIYIRRDKTDESEDFI